VSILCEPLDANVREIVAEWKQLTNRPPWTELTPSQWVDHLPPLLRAMITAVICGDGSHEARREVVSAAIQHGEHRRAVELPYEILFDEESYLRRAAWHFLSARAGPDLQHEVVSEIIRLDVAIGVATIASLQGYHRHEIEANRPWTEVITQLVDDWETASLTRASAVPG